MINLKDHNYTEEKQIEQNFGIRFMLYEGQERGGG